MTAQHFVRYDVDDRVAVITLDRPDAANAQTPGILKDLDDAWRRADEDAEVRVIVLQTTGKHFSAGHDMSGIDPSADGRSLSPQEALVFTSQPVGASALALLQPWDPAVAADRAL